MNTSRKPRTFYLSAGKLQPILENVKNLETTSLIKEVVSKFSHKQPDFYFLRQDISIN
jgi:hypothetical protein